MGVRDSHLQSLHQLLLLDVVLMDDGAIDRRRRDELPEPQDAFSLLNCEVQMLLRVLQILYEDEPAPLRTTHDDE